MKNTLILILIFINLTIVNAQGSIGYIEIFTNVSQIDDYYAFFEDDLYFVMTENSDKYLAKLENIVGSSIPINDVVFILDLPDDRLYRKMDISQGDLFINTIEGSTGKILKIDLNSTNPQVIEALEFDSNNPHDIAVNNTNLFILQYFSNSESWKISKLDYSNQGANLITVSEFTSNYGVRSFIATNNDLYYSNLSSINNIDLSDPTFTPQLYYDDNFYSFELAIDPVNNVLFTTSVVGNGSATRVLDITTDPPTLLLNQNNVFNIGFNIYAHNGYLFEGKFRYSYMDVLSTSEFDSNDIILFPNPVTTGLHIKGIIEPHYYEIYNIQGSKISLGIVNPNEAIDINNFARGVYFLKIKNESQNQVFKFVKK